MEEIEVMYGGSDCSCKHIGFNGVNIKLADLLSMLLKAQELQLNKVCIVSCQFDPLIDNIRQYCGKPVEG